MRTQIGFTLTSHLTWKMFVDHQEGDFKYVAVELLVVFMTEPLNVVLFHNTVPIQHNWDL